MPMATPKSAKATRLRMTEGDRDRVPARLRSLSYLLDNAIPIPIPGTGIRIGLDPLLGLLPTAGDGLGMVLSAYILIEAARLGASPALLARMAFNIALETVAGTVPALGDLFDAAWKANAKNLALLERHLQAPTSEPATAWGTVGLLLGGLLLLGAGLAIASVALVAALLGAIS